MKVIKKGRSEVLRLQERFLFLYIILSIFSDSQINAQACSGSISYTRNAESISLGATANAAPTAALCEAACTADSACLSYQTDSNSGTASFCWLQRTTLSQTRPVANIVEFVKFCNSACPSGQIIYIPSTTSVSNGATANPATTEAACEAACTADSGCLSYQLDITGGATSLCWLQRSTLSVTRPATAGITERIKSCGSACPSGQIRYITNSVSVSNGATANPATTEATCEAACTADSGCLSYQLDTTVGATSLCWLQRSSLSVTRPAIAGITEKIKSCCTTRYSTNTNPTLISNNAIANPGATEAQCEAACTADSTCLSYQLDNNPGTSSFCWLQKSPLSNTRVATNIIERIKILDCGTNCVTKYTPNSSSISTGAVTNPALTQPLCEAACTADNACLSYQIDQTPSASSFCWLQKATLSNFRVAAGITEYVKYQDCGSTPTTNVCPTVFESNSTLVSVGATSYSQASTFDSCRSACLSSASCLSFQINSKAGQPYCWLQTRPNAFIIGTLWDDPLTVEYIKIIRCSTTTAITTICPTIFRSNSSLVSIGASSTTFTNEPDCRSACLDNPKCLAYQINSNINEPLCWLQINGFSQGFWEAPNTVEKLKKKKVPTATLR